MYEYRAKLAKAVDGDTVYLLVDQGLDTTRKLKARFNRINCPELKDVPAGPAAKAYTDYWITANSDAEGWFIIRTVKDRTEKYGRYLVDIYDYTGRICLNAVLVDTGHATYKEY